MSTIIKKDFYVTIIYTNAIENCSIKTWKPLTKKDIMVDKEELIKIWREIFESNELNIMEEREKLIKYNNETDRNLY